MISKKVSLKAIISQNDARMPQLMPISEKIWKKARIHGIENKLKKQIDLLSHNQKHPSLRIELLEPSHLGIYSFRIDRKYRALFFYRHDTKSIQILTLTVHYK